MRAATALVEFIPVLAPMVKVVAPARTVCIPQAGCRAERVPPGARMVGVAAARLLMLALTQSELVG